MNTFTLPTGRKVTKNAEFCVAVKARSRWSTQFFKSYKGAQNEYRRLRVYCADKDMCAYYGLQDYKMIRPD